MILTRLIGGLGNQMFQYALARHLAEKHQAELKLDITGFEVYKLHDYSLNKFNVVENIAKLADIERFKTAEQIASNTTITIRETDLGFRPEVLDVPADTYLIGYWQCEKYFLNIQDILIQEFSPRSQLTALDERLKAEMLASPSVSVHVRRGDYVSNPQTNAVHGVCGMDYYQQATRLLVERCGQLHFFVFSDDPQWCQENLKFPGKMTVVSHNGRDRNFMDIHLMSCCSHHITANSSFSWWGAWLNSRPGKLVIAPAAWFLTTEYNAKDIVPESWIRL